MKLRNKKTGEIGELHYYPDKEYHFAVSTKDPTQTRIYKTLGELLQDWTDFIVHEPAEPQIKDRYPREAVRNWAEVVGGKDDISVTVRYDRTTFENKYGAKIVFTRVLDFTDDEFYEPKVLHRSIDRLCGEEEE